MILLVEDATLRPLVVVAFLVLFLLIFLVVFFVDFFLEAAFLTHLPYDDL